MIFAIAKLILYVSFKLFHFLYLFYFYQKIIKPWRKLSGVGDFFFNFQNIYIYIYIYIYKNLWKWSRQTDLFRQKNKLFHFLYLFYFFQKIKKPWRKLSGVWDFFFNFQKKNKYLRISESGHDRPTFFARKLNQITKP